MMDSNTSLPSVLTPKRFLAFSAICLDRSDLACTCFSGRSFVQSCGRATCINICNQGYNLIDCEINCVAGEVVVKLVLG